MHACAIPPRISRQRPKRPMSDIMGSSRESLGSADLRLRRGARASSVEKAGLKRLKEYDCACGSSVRCRGGDGSARSD